MENIIKTAAVMTALEYLGGHAEWYWLPICVRVKPKGGQGGTYTKLSTMRIHKQEMIRMVEAMREGGPLDIRDNVVKVVRDSETAWTKVNGVLNGGWQSHIRPLDGDESCYNQLPKDPSECAGPRARTFEKRVCSTNGFHWMGGLNRVQVDGCEKYVDENGVEVKVFHEVKGKNGRITAFVPSEVDKD